DPQGQKGQNHPGDTAGPGGYPGGGLGRGCGDGGQAAVLHGGVVHRHCRTGGRSLGLASQAAPGLRERDSMDGEATGMAAARRWTIDVAVLIAIGLLMGFLGPFASERAPIVWRYVYWMICMVGGGLIGAAVDDLL